MEITNTITQDHCKLAIIGNVDSGKSTIVGVLTKATFDDGRGYAREKVFNFKHEVDNGRTTSVAHEIMGFDENNNQVIPERMNSNKNKTWKEIREKSTRIVSFLDMCGHEKYLKTTIYGLVSMLPDYSFIVIGANMGLSKMTREHIGISLFLKIPIIIVLTKIDIAPAEVLAKTLNDIKAILKHPMVNKTALIFDKNTRTEDIDIWANQMHGNQISPVFQVSNVTGDGLPQLTRFISLIKNRDMLNKGYGKSTDPLEYDINENFMIPGIGLVVSGLVKSGVAKLNSVVLLGPTPQQDFIQVAIKSIHVNRGTKDIASVGEFACFQIKPVKATDKIDRSFFKKGMVLIDQSLNPEATWEIKAKVNVLHHSTTMNKGYQAVLHCGVVRQVARIEDIEGKDFLQTGDIKTVKLRFVHKPEYIRLNQTIIMREGHTKIFGTVTSIEKT